MLIWLKKVKIIMDEQILTFGNVKIKKTATFSNFFQVTSWNVKKRNKFLEAFIKYENYKFKNI